MAEVFPATFEDGVFKPDRRPNLMDNSRVRITIEAIDADESERREESWAKLQQMWNNTRFDSGGNRLNREQLHDRR